MKMEKTDEILADRNSASRVASENIDKTIFFKVDFALQCGIQRRSFLGAFLERCVHEHMDYWSDLPASVELQSGTRVNLSLLNRIWKRNIKGDRLICLFKIEIFPFEIYFSSTWNQ